MCIFYFLLDLAIVNISYIHGMLPGTREKVPQLDFRVLLVNMLLDQANMMEGSTDHAAAPASPILTPVQKKQRCSPLDKAPPSHKGVLMWLPPKSFKVCDNCYRTKNKCKQYAHVYCNACKLHFCHSRGSDCWSRVTNHSGVPVSPGA